MLRGSDLNQIFTGLSSSTEYNYRVRYCSNYGPSPWSRVVTVTTTRMLVCQLISCQSSWLTSIGHAVTSEHLHKAIQNNDLDTIRSIIQDKLVELI